MNWLFYLDDDIEIDEPVGFEALELSIKRHDTMHGMVFAASLSSLEFYGVAYEYLKNKKETEGIRANVKFSAFTTCDTYDYEEVLSGRLNFGKYKESCGSRCSVFLPWEEDSCEVVLKSREDQKVDVDRAVGVDGVTPLEYYNEISLSRELPAKDLRAAVEGYVSTEGDNVNLGIFPSEQTQDFAIRPTYQRKISANINQEFLLPTVFAASQNGLSDSAISPVVLLQEEISCFTGEFQYEVRLKGTYNFFYDGITTEFHLAVAKGEFPLGLTFLHNVNIPLGAPPLYIGTFDQTFTGTVTLDNDDGFYAYIGWTGLETGSDVLQGDIFFDADTYVSIRAIKSCPATETEMSMVHETLSRVVEAVTNGCMRVKSSYYGRTDSEPFSFPEDGCGGLRTLTSGLKIRQAEQDKFFVSFKDLIEGLNAIDNIGREVRPDETRPGAKILVIEEMEYFYQDIEVLRHDAIPEGNKEIEEGKHYSKIDVGYKKWEVEDINGLDEFNSNRQYNTSFDTVNTPLDITSGLIAGSYPLEIARQQSFADTGAADTKYDNETFIICMRRTSYPYGNIEVEQDNIDDPANIFSPETSKNYRISPIRNLMRWFKTIAAGFVSLSDTASKLFFSSGTGNMIAEGKMTDVTCRQEAAVMAENQNVFITAFADSADATPIWKPETLSYAYPMSLADYKAVKTLPYGYISAQCGNGDVEKYWIQEIKYKPAKGTAQFVLRKKYSQ